MQHSAEYLYRRGSVRRRSRFLRPFPYLITSRERAPGASGWAGQSGGRDCQLMQSCGSHCPCDREAKPSSAGTSGNHPTHDGTAGTRLTSLVVPGGGGHGAACHGPPGPPCPGSRGSAPRSAQNIPSLLCTGCPRAQPQSPPASPSAAARGGT